MDFYSTAGPLMIANTLEWYEFSCYGFLSDEIAANFFQGSSVATWGAFAATFVARPIGGLLFGYMSDSHGRKPALLASVWIMGAATLGQGVGLRIPYLGSAWMILCRVGQGLATGGEIGSLAVYIAEKPAKEIKGMAIQVIGIGNALGCAAACSVIWGLRSVLSKEQMLNWGWRLPFLFAAAPAIWALWSVSHLEETEEYQALQSERSEGKETTAFFSELATVVRCHWPQGLMTVAGMFAYIASNYLFGMYYAEWAVKRGVSLGTPSAMLIAGQLLAILVQPVSGYAVDTYGVATACLAHGLLGMVLSVPQYWLVYKFPQSPCSWVGVAIGGILQGLGCNVFLWVPNLFPTEVRGLAVCFFYNLGSLSGGFAPMICSFWVRAGVPLAPAYYTFAACGVTAATMGASLCMNRKGGQPLQVAHIINDPY